MRVRAWRVHDTGLVAAPGRFRRLPGLVRHHQGGDEDWPDEVDLHLEDALLSVSGPDGTAVGHWPVDAVAARMVASGPPVQFVIEVAGTSLLLAAPAGPATDDLLSALGA